MANVQTIRITDSTGTPVAPQAISIPSKPGTLIISVISNYVEMGFDGPSSFDGYPGSTRTIRINSPSGDTVQPFRMPIPQDVNGQIWFYAREAGAPNATVSVMILCGSSGGSY